jgi:hypothetical protein
MNSSHLTHANPTHEEIAVRARELWYARNCPTGLDEEIWMEAERQIRAERPIHSSDIRVGTRRDGIDIDNEALADRLDDYGNPGSRSATSVDPTTLT